MEYYRVIVTSVVATIVVVVCAIAIPQYAKEEGGWTTGGAIGKILLTLVMVPLVGLIAASWLYAIIDLPLQFLSSLKDGSTRAFTLLYGLFGFAAWSASIELFKKTGGWIAAGVLLLLFIALPLTGLTLIGILSLLSTHQNLIP
jgi:hypothetical protein